MSTFENCRCPKCKTPMDDVSVKEPFCPYCLAEIDPPAVWMTRKYPGQFILPGWITAFGWPVLLMAFGLGLMAASYLVTDDPSITVSGGFIGIGFAWFMIKIITNGEA